MKKSLSIAIEAAKDYSRKCPLITVMVMDKKGKQAVMCCSAWTYRERVLDGWHTVFKFKNGKEV